MFFATKSKGRPIGRLGIRSRLTIFFLVVFGGLFVSFAAGMYWYVAGVYRTEFDTGLYNYVVDISHIISARSEMGPVSFEAITSSEMMVPFSPVETLVQVIDEKGEVVSRSPSLGSRQLPPAKAPPERWLAQKAFFSDFRFASSGEEAGRDVSYRLVSHGFRTNDGAKYLIQAAVPLAPLKRQREVLLVFLSVAVPVTLTLAALAGLAFSRRAMGPVAAITAKANEIEARRLSERIPLSESRDEIHELASTLNNLLDRLEAAFRAQEAFVADASHQLKTPLSILKGELDVFRQGARSPEELGKFLESARQEVDYLVKIVEDLLLHARVDGGCDQWSRRRFRLDEKLLDCVARASRVAAKKRSRISVDMLPDRLDAKSFEVEGDPELIRSLIENLLDNSVKYSPEGTVVVVKLEESRRALTLRVIDQGPGIPAEAFPRLFDRFFRADQFKHRVPGSGLGLPIVRRIAELHGGAVTVRNRPEGGAEFQVELPRAHLA